MDSNRPVAQHRLGPRGGDGDVVALFGQGDVSVLVLLDIGIGGPASERIFEVPHVAVNFGGFDFQIGNRRLEVRIPIHQPLAAIDQALVVHINKDLDYRIVEIAFFPGGCTRCTRHGKGVARPVAGGAKALELFDDRATRLGFPLPDFGGEIFA